MQSKKFKGMLIYLAIIIMLVIGLVSVLRAVSPAAESVSYSSVISQFDKFNVSHYKLNLGSGELKYKLKGEEQVRTYYVPNVSIFLSDTENYRKEYNGKGLRSYFYLPICENTW